VQIAWVVRGCGDDPKRADGECIDFDRVELLLGLTSRAELADALAPVGDGR
jgi:hypothetical protein